MKSRLAIMAFAVAFSIGFGASCSPSSRATDYGWVLLVRPEGRLYLDNTHADWMDYLAAARTPYASGPECMAAGRRLFEGQPMVPGSEANEALSGQSIQCVRKCYVDSGAAVMLCEEVTSPEIYR